VMIDRTELCTSMLYRVAAATPLYRVAAATPQPANNNIGVGPVLHSMEKSSLHICNGRAAAGGGRVIGHSSERRGDDDYNR
jgi:hypothetical protein